MAEDDPQRARLRQHAIRRVTVHGYKSIRSLEQFDVRPLNVLIGANGAGKSNFIGVFHVLAAAAQGNLKLTVARAGGAQLQLYAGDEPQQITFALDIGGHAYSVTFGRSTQDHLLVEAETIRYALPGGGFSEYVSGAAGEPETSLKSWYERAEAAGFATEDMQSLRTVYRAVTGWTAYHFHDTGDHAPPKKRCYLVDGVTLRADGGNVAAFLYALRHREPWHYKRLRDTVRLIAPFLEDFDVDPLPDNPEQTQLRWRQKGTARVFQAGQLSDGTLRFICLVAALIQPRLPATILIDEPELGLHPYALEVLAALLQTASHSSQVIVSTQSAMLLSEFVPEDVVVVERDDEGASQYRRLRTEDLKEWLGEYTLGDLWWKNVLGGKPG